MLGTSRRATALGMGLVGVISAIALGASAQSELPPLEAPGAEPEQRAFIECPETDLVAVDEAVDDAGDLPRPSAALYLSSPVLSSPPATAPPELAPPITDVLAATVSARESRGEVQVGLGVGGLIPEYIPVLSALALQVRADTDARAGLTVSTGYQPPLAALASEEISTESRAACDARPNEALEELEELTAELLGLLPRTRANHELLSREPDGSAAVRTWQAEALSAYERHASVTSGPCSIPGTELGRARRLARRMDAIAAAARSELVSCLSSEMRRHALDSAFEQTVSLSVSGGTDFFVYVDEPLVTTTNDDGTTATEDRSAHVLRRAFVTGSLTWSITRDLSVWATAGYSWQRPSAHERYDLDQRIVGSLTIAGMIPWADMQRDGFRPGIALGAIVGLTGCFDGEETPCRDKVAEAYDDPFAFDTLLTLSPFVDIRISAAFQVRVGALIQRYELDGAPAGAAANPGELIRVSPVISLTTSRWEPF